MSHNRAVEAKERAQNNKPGFINRVLSRLTIAPTRGEKYTDFTITANNSRFMEKQQAIVKKGARAKATVLRMEPTGQEINGKPVVLISLSIDEFTSVVIQITSEALITSDHIPNAGERIIVAFDPEDTGIIVVV